MNKSEWIDSYTCGGKNKADRYVSFFELGNMLGDAWDAALKSVEAAPSTSVNNAGVKCPRCGKDLIIEVTSPIA